MSRTLRNLLAVAVMTTVVGGTSAAQAAHINSVQPDANILAPASSAVHLTPTTTLLVDALHSCKLRCSTHPK